MKALHFLIGMLIGFSAVSCIKQGPKGDKGDPGTQGQVAAFKGKVSGWAQKGPFVAGSGIAIGELDVSFSQTGRSFSANIDDNTGSFSVSDVTLVAPVVRISADGFYFNEFRHQLSDARLAIFAYADLTAATTVNVNLLGHLEAARIDYLVKNGGNTFAEARTQAHTEVLGMFYFDAQDVNNAENLDIAQLGSGNAKLLAMSIILQGPRSVAELTELLANLQTDIRTDGVLDSDELGSALMNGARTADRVAIRQGLVQRYADLGVAATIPDFEAQLDHFITTAPYAFTGGITYPTGDRPNVLSVGATQFTSETPWPSYGFLANLPPATTLTVRITRTGGLGSWAYAAVNGLDWQVGEWWEDAGGLHQEYAATHSGEVDLVAFELHEAASATFEFFEYGSLAPTWTKEVTWAP